jgi:hypothetical protein
MQLLVGLAFEERWELPLEGKGQIEISIIKLPIEVSRTVACMKLEMLPWQLNEQVIL